MAGEKLDYKFLAHIQRRESCSRPHSQDDTKHRPHGVDEIDHRQDDNLENSLLTAWK